MQRAANKGDGSAQGYLAGMYLLGHGVEKDEGRALFWARKAAVQNVPEGFHVLGAMHLAGSGGLEQSDKEAAANFLRAAEGGFAEAQSNLGILYRFGRGVAQSDQQAVSWLRKAAEQGHAVGQLGLGEMYYLGLGVPLDYAKAMELCTASAAQDNASALFSIGVMHLKGQGVPQSQDAALAFFRKAAALGDDDAQQALDQIEKAKRL